MLASKDSDKEMLASFPGFDRCRGGGGGGGGGEEEEM